jgi:hypothetical protein
MNEFAAITCFFSYAKNPYAVERFIEFKDHLKKQGVDLYVIELAFFDEEYLLDEKDIYLRLRTESVLWHKESLLNTLVKRLPPHIKKIAWLDGDIIIQEDNWAEECAELLDVRPLIQIGHQYLFEEKDGRWLAKHTVGRACQDPDRSPADFRSHHVGLGWAANREFFDKVGLFDYDITGSGDTILFYSAGSFWESSCSRWLRTVYDKQYKSIYYHLEDYINKCNNFFGQKKVAETIGYVHSIVRHGYHGNLQRRGYVSRLDLLKGISLRSDLTRDKQGLLEWVDKKSNEPFKRFFLMKDEDSDEPCNYHHINKLK